MKILVTGGAGFIGSEFVRQLVKANIEVNVIDSLTYAGNLTSIQDVLANIQFENIDIKNKEKLEEYFKKETFDVVVNFAAETHVDNSISSPNIFVETNIIGTFNLLELARIYDFKFLQISTDEVYGSIKKGAFYENSNLNPSSPYSATKASAELLMNAYVSTYNVRALGVRCSNNYGPFQNSEKLIPRFISLATSGHKLPLYGTGTNVREWIHVSDSVEGIITVLKHGRIGEYYNISSGIFKENLEVTMSILEYFGFDESQVEFVEDRLGHDFRYAINSDKIRKELGWTPKIDFEDGLKSTIEWYISNPTYLDRK